MNEDRRERVDDRLLRGEPSGRLRAPCEATLVIGREREERAIEDLDTELAFWRAHAGHGALQARRDQTHGCTVHVEGRAAERVGEDAHLLEEAGVEPPPVDG